MKVVLALGVHDSDFVDAYYGPPEWRTAAQAERRSCRRSGPSPSGCSSAPAFVPAGSAGREHIRPEDTHDADYCWTACNAVPAPTR